MLSTRESDFAETSGAVLSISGEKAMWCEGEWVSDKPYRRPVALPLRNVHLSSSNQSHLATPNHAPGRLDYGYSALHSAQQ